MNTSRNVLQRSTALATSLLIAMVGLTPALFNSAATAAQVTTRSIKISDSTLNATGVTYDVTFTTANGYTPKAVVVDFCNESPIINNSTCTTPTSFTVGASPTFTNNPDSVSNNYSVGAGWTASSLNSGRTFMVANASSATATSGTANVFNFAITGVHNPNQGTAGSFYARIMTFTSVPGSITEGSIASIQDSGGIALSTVNQISISATVQETLTFCVSKNVITGTCGSLAAPSLIIGTGNPPVLDTAGEAAPAYTQLTTNALTGAVVRMKATNACTNGGLSIAAPDVAGGCSNIVGTGASATALVGGKWGMCVAPGAGVTADSNYTDSANACPTTFNATSTYGMDGTNLTSTYGDPIYSTSGAVNAISSSLTFAAMAANTTPAGVYQGNESLIATGTF